MKRTLSFVQSIGTVQCVLPGGETVDVPVVPGILKHPRAEDLPRLLQDPDTLRKYTVEALRKAPWRVVRQFPRQWLVTCMATAALPAGRLRALEFMLEL